MIDVGGRTNLDGAAGVVRAPLRQVRPDVHRVEVEFDGDPGVIYVATIYERKNRTIVTITRKDTK